MLKWSVISRRNQDGTNAQRPQTLEIPTLANSLTPRSKAKRRHSGTNRGRISLPNKNSLGSEQDKENQFTSTPIKSLEDLNLFDPFRDVSNLTPKERNERRTSGVKVNHRSSLGNLRNEENTQTSPIRSLKKSKKRKSFLTPFRDHNLEKRANHSSQFFKHFEAVDSHIGALPDLPNCDCDKNVFDYSKNNSSKRRFPDIYAPTLPTFTIEYSPSSMKTTHCLLTLNKGSPSRATPLKNYFETTREDVPCFKKPKIDHVNDFLHQISFLTSPEERGNSFDFNSKYKKSHVKVSPLVKKFVDLGFSNNRITRKELRKGIHDSSFINDLSLNDIVDAILDESDENYSDIHVKDDRDYILPKKENELNETHEENLINAEFEKKISEVHSWDRFSLDSGFKSSTTTESSHYHQLEGNFHCKCNNNNNSKTANPSDKTIINLNETYNERCVDGTSSRKRPSSDLEHFEMETKRLNLCRDHEVTNFALKRQKCIRRRRTNEKNKFMEKDATNTPLLLTHCEWMKQPEEHNLNDDSFESSIVSDSDIGRLTDIICRNSSEKKNKVFVNSPSTNAKGRIRRCLLFDPPDTKNQSINFSSLLESDTSHQAPLIHLKIQPVNGELNVHVIGASNLSKSSTGTINSYVKVYLSNQSGAVSGSGKISQRVAVQADTNKPIFNHVFKLGDCNKHERLHIDVWHRDRTTRTLGDIDMCGKFSLARSPQDGLAPHGVPTSPCLDLVITENDFIKCEKEPEEGRKYTLKRRCRDRRFLFVEFNRDIY